MEKRRKLLFLAGLIVLVTALSLAVYSSAGAVAPYAGYTYGTSSGLYINLIREHNEPSTIENGECLSCHDNLLLDVSPANEGGTGAGSIPANEPRAVHKRHVMTVFLNFADNVSIGLGGGSNLNGCVKCHSGADIDNDRGKDTAIRKQVSPTLCLQCHGVFDDTPGSTGSTAHTTTRVRDGVTTNVSVSVADPRGCIVVGACHVDGTTGQTPAVAHPSGVNWINTTYAASANYCLKCHGSRPLYGTNVETNP